MLAVVINDGALDVAHRPTPSPGAKDVVVEVHGAGVNAADLLQRRGFYPAPPDVPADVPGLEVAGVVCSVGPDVDEPLLGRRVCAIVGGGAQATHCVVPSEHLIAVPDDVSWEEAGGFAEAFLTAHDALVTQGGLTSNQRVLISGATGGVGVAGVQIARLYGAHAIAVTRTSQHHDRLRELGADETVTLDQVGDVEPVDVVLELLGAAHLSLVQHRLAPFARVIVIGVGVGARVDLDLLSIMRTRASVTGSTLRARNREDKAKVTVAARDDLLEPWIEGLLHVPIDRAFDLEDVSSAYDHFAAPGKFGKVVLRVE